MTLNGQVKALRNESNKNYVILIFPLILFSGVQSRDRLISRFE